MYPPIFETPPVSFYEEDEVYSELHQLGTSGDFIGVEQTLKQNPGLFGDKFLISDWFNAGNLPFLNHVLNILMGLNRKIRVLNDKEIRDLWTQQLIAFGDVQLFSNFYWHLTPEQQRQIKIHSGNMMDLASSGKMDMIQFVIGQNLVPKRELKNTLFILLSSLNMANPKRPDNNAMRLVGPIMYLIQSGVRVDPDDIDHSVSNGFMSADSTDLYWNLVEFFEIPSN